MDNLESRPHLHRVLETAMFAGRILLENGAELHRVEETMKRIASHYGAAKDDFFLLSNGIFVTGVNRDEADSFARVQEIPIRSTNLSKVIAVNQVSREVEAGNYDIEELFQRLTEIDAMPGISDIYRILAAGVGSAGFCYIFGGNWQDTLVSLIVGILTFIYVVYVGNKLNKIVNNILGGALVTLLCTAAYYTGLGHDLSMMIIGCVMPLVPGVAFLNGIRDIGNEDYISGAVRILDAILVFVCIAIGVGVVFAMLRSYMGGVVL